jgi:hypothetical protein
LVIITSTFGSNWSYGRNAATLTFAGAERRSACALSSSPVVATTSTSRSASDATVGPISRSRSELAIVPWVTSTTGRSPSRSAHQAGGRTGPRRF